MRRKSSMLTTCGEFGRAIAPICDGAAFAQRPRHAHYKPASRWWHKQLGIRFENRVSL
jgi:hypothetical protein